MQGVCSCQDAYFAGIAVSEGVARRPVIGVTPRRIEVIVNRGGKVALYLEMSDGSADWHLLPSAQTQITDVVLGWGSAVNGLSPSVQTQRVRPSSPAIGNGCHQFQPPGYAYLGGPAALALDQGLQVLTGRGLDSLLRNTNDGSWPSVFNDPDGPRVTLVIE